MAVDRGNNIVDFNTHDMPHAYDPHLSTITDLAPSNLLSGSSSEAMVVTAGLGLDPGGGWSSAAIAALLEASPQDLSGGVPRSVGNADVLGGLNTADVHGAHFDDLTRLEDMVDAAVGEPEPLSGTADVHGAHFDDLTSLEDMFDAAVGEPEPLGGWRYAARGTR